MFCIGLFCVQKNIFEEEIMLYNAVIIISVIVIVGGSILAWWYENGPSRDNKTDLQDNVEENER